MTVVRSPKRKQKMTREKKDGAAGKLSLFPQSSVIASVNTKSESDSRGCDWEARGARRRRPPGEKGGGAGGDERNFAAHRRTTRRDARLKPTAAAAAAAGAGARNVLTRWNWRTYAVVGRGGGCVWDMCRVGR